MSEKRDGAAPGGTVRALELFCGIGGFAAAVAGWNVQVVGALDQSAEALAVYRRNFPTHPAHQLDLERVSAWELTNFSADLWWLSPPCQPYCERGVRRDLADHRARSLVRILELLGRIPDDRLPRHLALENVAGFVGSQAHDRLTRLLSERGYSLLERQICPTGLGVPSRRPRYYLAASRGPLPAPEPSSPEQGRGLGEYLDPLPGEAMPPELRLADGIIARFGKGLRILDPSDPSAYTTCFTAGYGRSIVNAGSYLRHDGTVRRFTPGEIARLLHFPAGFSFPATLSLRKQWHLVGNSLSITAVREVLRAFPELCSSART
ncbi:DNA cytosine methyltransferase [Geobacter argillaceus]|uniref:DNA (cytosine-5-)-methyltransferase n=1 Tax=Geobacter argillaceus TaxID=345631 RepID=A0A562VLV6_9BACT|nr:DNA cytosine methyltransferase [Geobacter argillaceus]TWJ18717.1 DNA (cytosine-5)-methyltransferase 1/tRNA (cytosine38-C5)-methyltransferase [Geobacter argillaceus]